jgi:uncharacterized protein (TIGR00645 family)
MEDEHTHEEKKTERIKTADEQGFIERWLESALWSSRLIVILAVIFGTISSIVLFIAGALEVIKTLYSSITVSPTIGMSHSGLLVGIIGAVDLFLIATVLLIFSFGVYELFISKIDIARSSESYGTLLEIHTLDDLKDKITKVIVMVLIVSFFQRVLELKIEGSIDMLLMALSIAAICIGVYFLHSLKH